MKKVLVFLCAMFASVTFAHTINWHVGDQIISTTTCSSGDSITPPTVPTKPGYHFVRWEDRPYTQLEYIESTGTQYINTGVPVSNDLTFGYKVSPKIVNQLSISQLQPSPGRSGLIVWQSSHNINIRYISDNSPFTTDTGVYYAINQVFDIIFNDNNKFYINGSLVYTKTNTIDTSGVLVTGVHDRVYSLWTKIDGVLTFNGIPCRRNSDNVLGIYDLVSGQFFTNAGTGDFVAGPEVGYLQ